jgi:hypothetical protein
VLSHAGFHRLKVSDCVKHSRSDRIFLEVWIAAVSAVGRWRLRLGGYGGIALATKPVRATLSAKGPTHPAEARRSDWPV